jgi:hypothetical protein
MTPIREVDEAAVDALDFALRTVSDSDLTEAEIRDRIGRVVGKALARLESAV